MKTFDAKTDDRNFLDNPTRRQNEVTELFLENSRADVCVTRAKFNRKTKRWVLTGFENDQEQTDWIKEVSLALVQIWQFGTL